MKNQIGGAALAAAALSLLAACGGGAPSATAASAGGGGLADGQYDCGGGYTFTAMGKVDIKGGQYRYRPFGDVTQGFAPYSVAADGTIQWGGKMGALDDAPAALAGSNRTPTGFNVNYKGNPDALTNTMSCNLERAPG